MKRTVLKRKVLTWVLNSECADFADWQKAKSRQTERWMSTDRSRQSVTGFWTRCADFADWQKVNSMQLERWMPTEITTRRECQLLQLVQDNLAKLEAWCGLEFHPQKCSTMVSTRSSRKPPTPSPSVSFVCVCFACISWCCSSWLPQHAHKCCIIIRCDSLANVFGVS